jgi:hypothetical protein
MRNEFFGQGFERDTGEIRQTFDLITFRSNLTFIPCNEIQTIHKHILVMEAVHVLAGLVHVLSGNHWKTIRQGEVAVFDLNELHNLRTTRRHTRIGFPLVPENISAIAIVYKWIPPYIAVYEKEVSFVLQNDWFDNEFKDNFSDPSTSPVLRLEKTLQKRFWKIVKRNNVHLKHERH